MNVFQQSQFRYPYKNIKFPGQHSEERILFITREDQRMFMLRSVVVIVGAIIAKITSASAINTIVSPISGTLALSINSIITLITLLFLFIAIWWLYTLWKKSLFILTTRRLTKFIHTTPWQRYQMSLGLDKIVDTGSYSKGFLQGLLGLGYFVARSSAGNIKKFYILNISFAEDLQNYVNKLLFTFAEHKAKLDTFRPFIPHLKGEARDRFVERSTPEYSKNKQQPPDNVK